MKPARLKLRQIDKEIRQQRARLLLATRHARAVVFRTDRSMLVIHRDLNTGEWRATRFEIYNDVMTPTGHEYYRNLRRAVGAYASFGPLTRIIK